MARSTRRTSVMLGGLAVVFVVIIIILCVVTKQPGYSEEPKVESPREGGHRGDVPTTTTPESTSTTISSTTPATPSPSPATTGPTTESDHDGAGATTPESTSTTISSTTHTTPSPSPATTGTTTESDHDGAGTTTPESTSTTISSTTTTSSSPTTTETTKESDPDATTITTLTSTAPPTTSTITTLESDDGSSTSPTPLTSTASTTADSTTETATKKETDANTTIPPTSPSTTTLPSTTTTTGIQETTITKDDSTTPTPTTSPTSPTTTTRPQLRYKECKSDACVSLAKDMNAMKDSSEDVNKCEDFYQFACGDVMKKPNIKPQQPGTRARMMIKDQLDLVRRNDNTTGQGKMRIFYDSCLKPRSQDARKDWAKPIKDMFGPYEFTESALDITLNFNFDKSAALGYMMRKGFKPLFNMELMVSEENAEAFVLSLHPTLPGSPFSDDLARKICLEEHHSHLLSLGQTSYNVTEEYEEFIKCVGTGNGLQARLVRMKDAVVRLGLMSHLNKPEEVLSLTLTKTKTFLKKLSDKQKQLHVPDLVKRLANRNYDDDDKMVSEFNTPTIDWETLLSKFLKEEKSHVSNKKIMVFQDSSNSDILDVLSEYEPAELNNILLLLWVEKVYTDFVKPVGANVGDPEYCLNTAIALMEEAASYLYLQAVNKKARDEQIDKIAESIKREGLRVLGNITTDGAETEALQAKLTEMMDDDVIKLSQVDEEVATESTSDVRLSEDFLQNSLLLLEQRSTLMGDQLQDVTDDMWRVFAHPYDPFGLYDYKLNRIMIPYAAQEPFQAFQGVPDYLHYARIGYQISHLMWHGYDTSGVAHPSKAHPSIIIRSSIKSLHDDFKAKYKGPRNYTNPEGLTAEYDTTDLTANEIWADLQATGLAWQAYVNRNETTPTAETYIVTKPPKPPTRRRRSADQPQDSEELVLPYLGMTPDQLYFLHWAQQFCTDSTDLRMLEVMESRQPPGRERVNFVTRHTPEFQEAFKCTPQEN